MAVGAVVALLPPVGGGPLGGAPGREVVGGLPAGALTGGAKVACLVSA